jgi:translation initiation factor IF-1
LTQGIQVAALLLVKLHIKELTPHPLNGILVEKGWIDTVGKRLVKNESDIRKKIKMPNKYDVLGVVKKNFGQTRMSVKCQDGETRACRVRGKMKKRNWVREGCCSCKSLGLSIR